MKHFSSVIDGMETVATEGYVCLINHRVRIAKDQNYLNYISVSDTQVPDRTAYIMDHSKPNSLYDLKDDALSQAKLSPGFFVMPCNTVHCFYDDLAALTDVPFLYMMRIAVYRFVDDFPREEEADLIVAEGSIYDHLCVDELERVDKGVELGGPGIQPVINGLIYSDIKEKGIVNHDLYHKILKTVYNKYGYNVILLGRTGLSLAQEKAPDHPYNVVDLQSTTADVSIELASRIHNGMNLREAITKYTYK